MHEGLVIQHGANRYLVEDAQARIWACSIAGRLRRGRQAEVRVAVIGDRVRFSPGEEESGSIVEVLARRNKISRPAAGGAAHAREQVVMANLDRLWVVASVEQPPLNLAFVDRILAAARHQGVEAGVVLNKVDLDEAGDAEAVRRLYEGLGYPVHPCSARRGDGVAALREDFAHRIGVFVGLSGVGKSSLVEALEPGLRLRTAEVGERSGQGRHTTTVSRLYRLANGGHLADTPGMRSFGLWGMVRADLSDAFVEFDELSPRCRFRDCLHQQEPGCAVRAAAEAGEVEEGRYRRYLGLLEELPERFEEWRRRPRR